MHDSHDLFLLLFGGFFGAVVGSFLNVCIYRLPKHESVAWPGSHCPTCSHAIAWYDNIPILSYVALGGRCRQCGVRIPLRGKVQSLNVSASAAIVLYEVVRQREQDNYAAGRSTDSERTPLDCRLQ